MWGQENSKLMDSLTKDWSRLSLSEQEVDTFDFENQNIKPGCMLAAKFFTKRALSIEAVARTLQSLWRTKNHSISKNSETTVCSSHLRMSWMWNGYFSVRRGVSTSTWLHFAVMKLINPSKKFSLIRQHSGSKFTTCWRDE